MLITYLVLIIISTKTAEYKTSILVLCQAKFPRAIKNISNTAITPMPYSPTAPDTPVSKTLNKPNNNKIAAIVSSHFESPAPARIMASRPAAIITEQSITGTDAHTTGGTLNKGL